MDRITRDSDNQYNIRRNENNSRIERRYDEYDTYDQTRPTEHRFLNRQNYDRNSQNNYYTYATPPPLAPPNNDQYTSGRKFQDNHQNDASQRVDVSYTPRSRVIPDNNQELNQRSQLPEQTQRTPKVEYTVQQNPSANPRSIVLDISISINVAGTRNPQITAIASALPPRSSPIRSTAVIEDIGYVDLDIRSPERTARLATDGLIRPSSSQQSTIFPNDNKK